MIMVCVIAQGNVQNDSECPSEVLVGPVVPIEGYGYCASRMCDGDQRHYCDFKPY